MSGETEGRTDFHNAKSYMTLRLRQVVQITRKQTKKGWRGVLFHGCQTYL